MIEQHQRHQNRSGCERKGEEQAVDANGRALIGRGQGCGRHGNPGRESGTEAQDLFQIVPLRARGFNRSIGLAGPLDHRSGIEPRIFPLE